MFKTAANIVKNGGVIAYPTESMWGLGCDPFNLNAVNKLLNLKQRNKNKGLILIAADLSPFNKILDYLSDAERQQIITAPYTTFLFNHNGQIPYWLSGGRDKFALRITKHLPAIKLCKACAGPLVSTSANLSSLPSAKTKQQVINYFGDKLDYIVDANIGNYTKPSTIIDFATNEVIRN